MATFSRVSPTGWLQGDDGSTFSRVSPTGWDQVNAAAAAFKAYWSRAANQLIGHAMKKNVSGQVIGVQMISASDGSAFTGAVTAYITKDGGVQAIGSGSPAGQCVHEGNGFHTYAPTQSETNADHIAFTFTATGAIASTVQVYTNFPQTGDNFARLGAPAGASVSADIAAVKTQTAAIEVDTQDIQTRLPAALVSGRIDASVGAIASGVDLTATMKASVNTEVDTALSDVGLTSTVTGRIDATVSSRATQTSVDTLTGYVDTEVAAIKAKTDNLPASPAATGDIPSAATVATAVRSELTTELGRIDVAVSTRASQTSVDTLTGYVDTEVAAIKTVTDKLNTTLGAAVGSPGEYEFTADALRNTPPAPTTAAIADAVWDEVLTGATHNVNGSAGKRLRQLASGIILSGDVTAATSNTVSLDSAASSTNGEYDPSLILIDSGPGIGQCRLILQYNGATKTAVVDRNWRVNPDNTSTYVLIADPGREHVNEGLAQAGTSTTITLNASASASDNAYVGQIVFIRSGTAQDQARRVLSYVGSTKVATVRAWDVTPDSTSAYVMLPTGKLSDVDMANAVWDAPLANHLDADTTGEALNNTDLRGERTVIRGTVGNATTPSTTQFTPSSITPAGAAADQFKGRIIIFDNDTATAALRGQATDITANSNASTPLFTFTALTTAPASGDTFSIV